MKKTLRLLELVLLSVLVYGVAACGSDDEVIPQLSVPEGVDNYFIKRMDFEPSTAEKSFTFNSNLAWTLSVSETRNGIDWLSVSPTSGEAGTHTVTVKATENKTYDDRNAVITIAAGDSLRKVFVNQKQLDALTLTSNRFEVPVDGATINIEVKANIEYEAIIPDSCKGWIHQSKKYTRGLSTSSLSFIIDKSEEYNKREGQIVIKGKDKDEIVTIYQVGEGILTLTSNEYNVNSSAQELAIEINSNFDYTIELPEVDWLKEITAQTRGISSHTLRLNISENESYENRSAKIRVYDKNSSISEEVVINQSQKDALFIDKEEYELDENGGIINVDVNSNVSYNINIDCDWITEATSTTRSLSTSNHSFNVNAITENSDRIGIIYFANEEKDIYRKVVIEQNRALFFKHDTYTIIEGTETKLSFKNRTTQEIIWNSSNPEIVSVDNTGTIIAHAKGNAFITATTNDGKHTCTCEIIVQDITDYITASCSTSNYVKIVNGLLMYPCTLYWGFSNKGKESIFIKSFMVFDRYGNVVNMSYTSQTIEADSWASYVTEVGVEGIRLPVTCRCTFEYRGKEYFVDAVYNGFLR